MIPMKRSIYKAILCIVLVFIIGVIRMILYRIDQIPYHGLICLVYIAIIFQWMIHVRKSFLQKNMRTYLLLSGGLMCLWITMRMIRYEFIPYYMTLSRLLWYGYYIPITLIPFFMFLASLYIGQPDSHVISRWWRLLFLPMGCIIGGILTNDRHQQAFIFQENMKNWNTDYTYGPLYYAAVVFLCCSLAGVLFKVFQTCARYRFFHFLWFSISILLFGGLYVYTYRLSILLHQKYIFQQMYELPEFICLFLIAFWESLVLTHLIPSNMGHDLFFQCSTIRAGVTDSTGNIILRSRGEHAFDDPPSPKEGKHVFDGSLSPEKAEHAFDNPPSPELTEHTFDDPPSPEGAEQIKESFPSAAQIIKALIEPVMPDGKHLILKSRRVQGGIFYWLEDIGELNRINARLKETGDYLKDEHFLLDATMKLEQSQKHTKEQNRLYDKIAISLRPQLDEVSALLEELPQEEEAFRKKMIHIAVLNAYMKRKSNLLLVADENPRISLGELKLSIEESLSYITFFGNLETYHVDMPVESTVDADMAIFLYDLFEETAKAALPTVQAVLVTCTFDEEHFIFYMECAAPTAKPILDWYRNQAGTWQGSLESEWDDDTGTVMFQVPEDVGE